MLAASWRDLLPGSNGRSRGRVSLHAEGLGQLLTGTTGGAMGEGGRVYAGKRVGGGLHGNVSGILA